MKKILNIGAVNKKRCYNRVHQWVNGRPLYHDWLRPLNQEKGYLLELHKREGGKKDICCIT